MIQKFELGEDDNDTFDDDFDDDDTDDNDFEEETVTISKHRKIHSPQYKRIRELQKKDAQGILGKF